MRRRRGHSPIPALSASPPGIGDHSNAHWLLDHPQHPGSFTRLPPRSAAFDFMHLTLIEPLESRIAPAQLSVLPASAPEGDAGTTSLIFTLTLDQAETVPVSVDFMTSDGTATSEGAAADFQAVSGMVTFDPGETSKNVIVPIIGDTVPEGPETLTLNLSNPQNAELASSEVTGTINDYNEAPVSLRSEERRVGKGS